MNSKEALEKIKNYALEDIDSIPLFAVDLCKSINKEVEEAYKKVLKDLERLEKQDKILEIIFKKNVDIELLKLSTNWLDYHTRVIHRTGKNTELTEEELVLLKGWLDASK